MNKFRPTVFIGSSTQGLDVARAIEVNLKDDAEITIWCNGVFGLSCGTLQSLVTAMDHFDFAILILTPDDVVSHSDSSSQAPRDNVLFELGLFMGRLGPQRTFVVSSDAAMKLPSDLAGVTLAHYESRRMATEAKAAVSPACFDIRNSIRQLGFTQTREEKSAKDPAIAPTTFSENASLGVQLTKLLSAEGVGIGELDGDGDLAGLERKANAGDPRAQYALALYWSRWAGHVSEWGHGIGWYEMSAKQGFLPAMYGLAVELEQGCYNEPDTVDFKDSTKWYRKTIEALIAMKDRSA